MLNVYITKEEMIMEAISQTEPENSKWLAGRRRRKEESAKEEEKNAAAKSSKTIGFILWSRFLKSLFKSW